MKNIFKILSIGIISLSTLTSCSHDWLDLKPSDGLPLDGAIVNAQDAFTALNGVYDGLQEDERYYGARMLYYGDVRADDMQGAATGTRTLPFYLMNNTATDISGIWEVPYKVIRRTNTLIAALESGVITDGEKAKLDDMLGQALAVRALAHFDMVRVYGKPYQTDNGASFGVPIVTSVPAFDYQPSRNTVAEVYSQVIADLEKAKGLMSSSKSIGYFNKYGAEALLSRVYLYKGDNQKAFDAAKAVIDSKSYSLWKNEEYVAAWTKGGNSELIFEIVNKGNDDWVDREAIGYLMAESGYGDLVLTQSFVNQLNSDPNDVRIGLTKAAAKKENIAIYKTNKVYVNKFPGRADFQPNDVRVNNVPVLRLSEIYLNAAEAAFKLGNLDAAVTYLNAISLRANPASTPYTSSTINLDVILEQRAKELFGEGHRFFDLMRNNKTVVRYTSEANIGWHLPLIKESQQFDNSYFRVLLPVPVTEIDANPDLAKQQNPGY